jgi:hypothetical protein
LDPSKPERHLLPGSLVEPQRPILSRRQIQVAPAPSGLDSHFAHLLRLRGSATFPALRQLLDFRWVGKVERLW